MISTLVWAAALEWCSLTPCPNNCEHFMEICVQETLEQVPEISEEEAFLDCQNVMLADLETRQRD